MKGLGMRKIKIMIIVIVIVFVIILVGFKYLINNHYINASLIGAYRIECADEYYEILYTQSEVVFFNDTYGLEIDIPEDFNYDNNAILVCSGHELVEAYYNIMEEENRPRLTHYLYVVLNKKKDNKVYLYKISNRYKSWFFSQKYSEDFNGIIYR